MSNALSMNGLPLPPPLNQPGSWPQIYRGKIPGKTHAAKVDNLKRKLDLYASLRAPGVLMHGFTLEMTPEVYQPLAELAKERGLLSAAAWGLDDSDCEGKGTRIGRVAKLRWSDGTFMSAFNVFDMEGAYDQTDDSVKSELMFRAYDKEAGPGTVVVDQPWPITFYHSQFPWRVTAEHVHVRAPQFYCNNYVKEWGKDAYEKFFTWAEKDWKRREDWYRNHDLAVDPRILTIQGYAWNLADCVTCLVTYPTQLVWGEPWPDDLFITAWKVVNALTDRGFTGPLAVVAFQQSAKLTVDGQTGPETLKALGVKPYDSSSLVVRVVNSLASLVTR